MAKKVEEKDVEKELEYDEYEELSLEDRVINIEKKVTAVLWLVVITMIVAILSLIFVISDDTSKSKSGDGTDTKETETSAEYDVSSFKEIKAQDLKKTSKDKTILVYIGRATCGYCVQFVPVLKEVHLYEKPRKNKRVNQAELNYIEQDIDIAEVQDRDKAKEEKAIPFFECFTYRQTWAFLVGKFMTDGVWWFFLFWAPAYFSDQYGYTSDSTMGILLIFTLYLIVFNIFIP